MRLLSAVLCALLWPALDSVGQQASAPDEIVCPRITQAPVIDGAPDDACWQTAAAVSQFTQPLKADPPNKGISARVCFDDDALYLAFVCEEPAPGRIKTGAQDGGSDVWKDDCVEVWIRVGDNQLDYDQFIVNATGARQHVRARLTGAATAPTPDWPAAARIGNADWAAEVAIPFALLGIEPPQRGRMVQLKLGREDHTGEAPALSTWPPGSRYAGPEDFGRLYFETANCLANPDMSHEQDGRTEGWSYGEADRELFSSVEDQGQRIIRFDAPGRYSTGQQDLRLKPDSVYRLEARVKGTAGIYLRARTSPREGDPSTPYTVNSKPSEEYQALQVRFPTGEIGEALIIIGNTEGHGKGTVYIADVRVSQDVAYDADGPAIPLPAGERVTVKKVPVVDCRALRGFIMGPVDGRLETFNWNMAPWEYNMRGAGAGVGYRYRNNDGLHITLADDEGVDAVLIRRGARVKLYRDAEAYDDPGDAPLVWEFEGRARTSRALFPERVKSRRFSFFDLEDGYIADCSFLRLSDQEPPGRTTGELSLVGEIDPMHLAPFVASRFGEEDRTFYGLAQREGQPVQAAVQRTIHLLTGLLDPRTGLAAVGLRLNVPDAPTGCPLTIAVQDPLNPRQELMGVDFTIEGGGELRPLLDFPDQVLTDARARPLWLSLTFGAPVTVEKAQVEVLGVPRDQALPEALAFRKLIMKGLFCILSEARPWNGFNRNTDLDEFYQENHWGAGVEELAETIAQCKALGPEDDTVRCYDEWFWRKMRDLPPFDPEIDDIPGAPEWAVVARQAWLTAREVAKWWLADRLVPTGEFGGLVGDDSDMYQNYADFPMFEDDGVGAQVKRAAANLAELAEEENLENGLNKHTTDPLHAYEEGVNHEALMLWWFYGDPVYFERCLLAAKSMPALTVVTDRGHRHFKNQDCGAEDLRIDRELGVDGHAHPLMLHPCFEVAWYNRSPKVVRFLREWADGWLEHQTPGEYATSVDVRTEEATETGQRPLYGGYGGQASAHNFLYWLTDDLTYIRPFMDFFQQGQDNWPARRFVPELWHRGALDDVEKRNSVLGGNPITQAIALGGKQPLIEALKADIAELQRFRTMYTDAEVFTDRVFLDALTNAAICYTGGFATRNKYNHTHAASWEGFGTEYAALVLTARRDHFKTLLYSFRDEPMSGSIRLWTLDHGRYRLTVGPDRNGDDEADSIDREETVEVARATAIPFTLPPRQVVALELTQLEELEPITDRPDLAISAREIEANAGSIDGVVHNIGGGDAPAFTVVLVDAEGNVRAQQQMPPLSAPLDLEPRRAPFRLDNVGDTQGLRVIVDPTDAVAEIFEGNNSAGL